MGWSTHEVINQVPELAGYNLYLTDTALRQAVQHNGAQWYEHELERYGQWLGRADTFALARTANQCAPRAILFDRWGNRADTVIFSQAWHTFMSRGFEQGMHSMAWSSPRPGAHVARAATYLLHGQLEAGSLCPLTMTSAAIPVLQHEALFARLQPWLYSLSYDGSDQPLENKPSMTIGMGLTEKQGGSDLRTNSTFAVPLGQGGRGGDYNLVGHKWFFSAPTSDAHLVLARHDEHFSCFYMPRWLPDGTKNNIHIQRLKDKMGNASNASAEVEFRDAYAVLVGEPGRGIATLVEMAANTRLDCVLGSTALLRQSVVQAMHHARHRHAFGKRLIEQPLMCSVLADLALESEAATVLALRLARAFDVSDSPVELAYRRILTPAAKFWVCKRAVEAAAECMEVWGGNGYIEEGPMPRLYREAPVNSIWEGSGNVMCLDVLRGLKRQPELADALASTLLCDSADEPVLAAQAEQLVSLFSRSHGQLESAGRYIAQQLVLLIQANLLRRHAPPEVAEGFIQTRLKGAGGRVFGIVPQVLANEALLNRAWSEY